MNSARQKRSIVHRLVATAALAFGLSSALALDIGTRSLLVAEASPMKSLTLAPTSASFTRFAVKVGGVAFTTTASSTDGSRIVGIRYDPSAADGSRIVLDIAVPGGAQVSAAVPAKDWVALPVAKFVDTGDHGAVTLFGSLKDSAKEAEYRQDRSAMIANYHAAFQDTLLGLRLLQADMVLIEDQTDDLFKDAGRYLLGAGEVSPTAEVLKANAQRRSTVASWLKFQPRRFQSYVVGDVNAKITFALRGGKLDLAGDPTWACWRRDTKAIFAMANQLTKAISADAYIGYISLSDAGDWAFDAADEEVPFVSPGNPIAERERRMQVGWKAMEAIARQALQRTGPGRPQPISFAPSELDAALKARDQRKVGKILSDAMEAVSTAVAGGSPKGARIEEEIRAVAGAVNERVETMNVVQMPEYSAALAKVMKEQRGINPVVYEALTTSVRTAAVLRAAKVADPTGYAKLMTTIAGRKSSGVESPSGYRLVTPTVYPRD